MASLFVLRGKDKGQHFAIHGSEVSLGREAENTIKLLDTEVSRRHAIIRKVDQEHFEVVDCDSSNGTFVNSRRIENHILQSGDRLQVGRTLMVYTAGPEASASRSAASVDIVNDRREVGEQKIRSTMGSQIGSPNPAAENELGSVSVVREALPPALGKLGDSINRESVSALLSGTSGLMVPPNKGSEKPSPSYHTDEAYRTSKDKNNDAIELWEIVYRVSQAITRTVDLDELLEHVLQLVFQWIECDRGCMMLFNQETEELQPACALDRKIIEGKQKGDDEIVMSERLKISRTILDHVVQNKQGVLTSDAQDDERWADAESVSKFEIREAMCVPMLGRYGLVGAIYVDTTTSMGLLTNRKKTSRFDDDHLKLMVAIAQQAALAVEDTQFYSAMVQAERLAAMGQVTANLSHHVKNILQGISGGSYLVNEGLKKNEIPVVERGWEIVSRNQARISNLVMDMLSFSKDRELHLSWSNLTKTVAEVVELMQNRAGEYSVRLIGPSANDPTIFAGFDEEAIHRALLNVVTNAIDATAENESGARQVVVSIQPANENGYVSIEVLDCGFGVSNEMRSKIFSPFESSKGSKGTGLGLPVSQKILQEHGGLIEIENVPDTGAKFSLKWPAGEPTKNATFPTQPG